MREAQELREKAREAEAQAVFIVSEPVVTDTQRDNIGQPSTEQVIAESGPSVSQEESSSFIEEIQPSPSHCHTHWDGWPHRRGTIRVTTFDCHGS